VNVLQLLVGASLIACVAFVWWACHSIADAMNGLDEDEYEESK